MLSGEWLCIDGLTFKCVIGVTEPERLVKQDIVVNLQLEMDFSKVGVSDSIHDSVDYRMISKRVISAGEASSFQLIESLAAHLSNVILNGFPTVQALRVEVEKPGALSAAKSVRAVIASHRASS